MYPAELASAGILSLWCIYMQEAGNIISLILSDHFSQEDRERYCEENHFITILCCGIWQSGAKGPILNGIPY